MLPNRIQRVLVVEDDEAIGQEVCRILESWGTDATLAQTASAAHEALARGAPFELLLVDVRLPDDSVFPLLAEAAAQSPSPVTVAMSGRASPDEAFRLAQHGVRAYLPKPFTRAELAAAIETGCDEDTPLEPAIAERVGRVPMRDLQRQVRNVMVREALARAHGNRSGAARLLNVTRQAVQQILRSERTEADAHKEEPNGHIG
jgi:DNA-binding NtrC family response regulator